MHPPEERIRRRAESFKFSFCSKKAKYIITPFNQPWREWDWKEQGQGFTENEWYDIAALMCIVLAVKWREMQIDISDQRSCVSVWLHHVYVCVCGRERDEAYCMSNEPWIHWRESWWAEMMNAQWQRCWIVSPPPAPLIASYPQTVREIRTPTLMKLTTSANECRIMVRLGGEM